MGLVCLQSKVACSKIIDNCYLIKYRNFEMIQFYNVYSKNVFKDKYAIWKVVLRVEIFIALLQKSLLFEFHLAKIVNLLEKRKNCEDSGTFKNLEEYFDFLNSDLVQDFNNNPPDEFLWGAYPLVIEPKEVNFFVNDFFKQKGYLTAKVYDKEIGQEMPDYYSILYKLSNFTDTFRGMQVPESEEGMKALVFEKNFKEFIAVYEKEDVFCIDYLFNYIWGDLEGILLIYLLKKEISLKSLNKIVKNIGKIEDIGIRKFFSFVLKSLSNELESNQIYNQCKYCGNFWAYKKNKTYCSLVSEGQDCGKKARNQIAYKKAKIKKSLQH